MKKLIISESQKKSDIETLFQSYDEMSNLLLTFTTIAKRYNYPDMSGIADAALELSAQVSQIANHIFEPEAVELLKAVEEKDSSFNTKVESYCK